MTDGGMSGPESRLVRVNGRVQGVGYRAWVEKHAVSRGLEGWVRNRRDGSVEAVFSGPEEVVSEMIAVCRRGPSSARVDRVHVETGAPDLLKLRGAGERRAHRFDTAEQPVGRDRDASADHDRVGDRENERLRQERGREHVHARPRDVRDHREAGAGLERGDDEIMAVVDVALDGEISLARSDGAAVDRDAGHRLRQPPGAGTARRRFDRLRRP